MTCWTTLARRPDAAVALYCLPHAGGSAASFAAWPAALGAAVDVIAADLEAAGNEPGLSIAALADRLAPDVADDRRPLALYGHSMGALLAYEMAHVLAATGRGPALLAVGACPAPDRPPPVPPPGADDDALAKHIAAIDPAAAALDAPSMAALLERLRVDFGRCRAYRSDAARRRLRGRVAVFGGQQDPIVPLAGLEAWAGHTSGACTIDLLPGGHFFPRQAGSLFFQVLNERLVQAGE